MAYYVMSSVEPTIIIFSFTMTMTMIMITVMMMMLMMMMMMVMAYRHIPTSHIPTWWEYVIMMKGGNMTQSYSHHV